MKREAESIGDCVWIHAREKYGTLKAAAKAWGISQSHLSGICKGAKKPTKLILDELGWTLAYVPKSSLQCDWQEVGRKAA